MKGYCEWLTEMYVSDLKREFYDVILGKVGIFVFFLYWNK